MLSSDAKTRPAIGSMKCQAAVFVGTKLGELVARRGRSNTMAEKMGRIN